MQVSWQLAFCSHYKYTLVWFTFDFWFIIWIIRYWRWRRRDMDFQQLNSIVVYYAQVYVYVYVCCCDNWKIFGHTDAPIVRCDRVDLAYDL